MFLRKITIFMALFVSVCLWSYVYSSDADDFLLLSSGAKPMALGQAYVAKHSDINAVYWNPAGLVGIGEKYISTTYAQLSDFDMTVNSLTYVMPLYDGVGGVNFTYLSVDDNISSSTVWIGGIPRPQVNGSFKAQNQALILSYGQDVKDNLSIGGNLKLLWQKINSTGSGFGIDIAAIYKKDENLRFGANLQNVISKLGPDRFPVNLKIGLSYDVKKIWKKDVKGLNIELDLNTAHSTLNIGSEYHLSEVSSLRVGLNDKDFTVGVGIKFGNFSLDYAYAGDDLGNTHRVSFTSMLGK